MRIAQSLVACGLNPLNLYSLVASGGRPDEKAMLKEGSGPTREKVCDIRVTAMLAQIRQVAKPTSRLPELQKGPGSEQIASMPVTLASTVRHWATQPGYKKARYSVPVLSFLRNLMAAQIPRNCGNEWCVNVPVTDLATGCCSKGD